jgi:hypothetical protein
MSDVSVYPPRYRGKQPGIEEIRRARVIFCPSDKLDRFFDDFESEITAKVILCGNSDFEFKDMPPKIPKSVRQLFLQNSFISEHPLVTTLPIGIENFRWGVNGNPKNLSPGEGWIGRRNEVLIGPFGLTHPVRIEVRKEFLEPAAGVRFISNRMEPREYAKADHACAYRCSQGGDAAWRCHCAIPCRLSQDSKAGVLGYSNGTGPSGCPFKNCCT